MADMERLRKNLEERGFQTSYFATAKEAADYLDAQIDKATVGIGGSMTIQAMGLSERLSQHNEVSGTGREASCAGPCWPMCTSPR